METKEIMDAIDEASKALKEKAEGASKQAADALEKAASALKDLETKASTEDLEALKKELSDAKEELQKQHDALSAKVNNPAFKKAEEVKSFNEVLKESIEAETDTYEKFLRKEVKSFAIELKAVGDMSTANVTGGSRYGQLMRPGIIENPKRKVHMDQILPGGSVGPGNTYTFMRENGQGEGAIAPTAEGATKPQLDLDLVEATVNIETIAGWLRVTRKAMNNIPGFISFLQSRLPEKFRRVLDAQILYGNGTTPNLKGILTAGNFVQLTNTADPLIEKLVAAISLLEDTYERDATAGLIRPADYYAMFLNKADGSGEYDLPQGVTFSDGVLRLLGMPIYATTALTAGDFVVGDFEQGAQLLTQEGMRIEFFEQDGTNVRENKVTVRIEGNYALPVYGPDYFIKGEVEAPETP